MEHPVFVRNKALPEPYRSHFPKNYFEAAHFEPMIRTMALDRCVLAVAITRVEGSWCAYISDVPGESHEREKAIVLERGAKIPPRIARAMFPFFDDIPYAP